MSSRARRHLVAAAWSLCAICAPAAAQIPQSERDALVALYNSTGGNNWTDHTGWNGAPGTECDWRGVICDSTGSTVTELHLSYNNLTGTLTPLAPLVNLEVFDATVNSLSGPIPPLAALTKLQSFSLLDNSCSGPIPSLTGLADLQEFNVDSNNLSGPFPSLAGLNKLQVFDIGDNHHTDAAGNGDANGITGTLPDLSALTQLQVFYVSGNKLSGTLPTLTSLAALQDFEAAGTYTGDGNHFTGPVPAIAGLTALQYFDVHYNQLTGPVPSLSNSPNLIGFSVSLNPLSGTIPSLANLRQIQYLGFYADGLSGQIPPLSSLTHLVEISVGDNNLNGSIPSLSGLTALQLFDASYNHLTGSIPSLSGLTQLQDFDVALNELTGPIPSLAGLAALLQFDVAYNHLSGSLPALTGSPLLYQFSANDNELTGSIPSFAGLTQLYAVELSDNQLTGTIPAINGSLLLNYFSVAQNQLTGGVPQLAGLAQLTEFNVSFNHLSGPIPALSGLTNLQYAYFDINQLSGPIPALTGLGKLQAFVVLGNKLSGPIPALNGLDNLQEFNAEGNQLTGALPTLSGLANLSYFSVTRNQLTGQLPQLSGLSNLSTFDVSFNSLTGPIPALSQLPNLQYLYLDVNELSGAIPSLSGLSSLLVFDANNNQLSGAIPSLSGLTNLQEFNVYSNALTGTLPSLAGLSSLLYFEVGSNFLSGALPSVPNPDNLIGGLSSLCPNSLTQTPDPNWDLAVGNEPWYATCTAPESANNAPTTKDSTHMALSGDGSIKVFQSQETDLVPGNQNPTGQDVYSIGADGLAALENIDQSGHQMIGTASLPAISADGKVVAFLFSPLAAFSAPTGVDAGQIYAGPLGGPKHLVDNGMDGLPANGAANGGPSLSSANGTYQLAFCSSASNLVSGDGNGARDIFLADPLNAAAGIQRVSLDSNGAEISGDSCEPKLSADGTKVVFSLAASGLFATPARQIVLKHLAAGSASTTIKTADPLGSGLLELVTPSAGTTHGANADSSEPAVNADGSVVAFTSQAADLDALGAPAGGHEVFVSLAANGSGTHQLARARSGDGTVPNGGSQQAQLSGDGTTLVVNTDATNLLGGAAGLCGTVALNTNFFALTTIGSTLCGGGGSSASNSKSATTIGTMNQNPTISANGIVTAFDSNARQANGSTNSNTYAQGMGSYTGLSGLVVPNLNGDFSGQWFNPNQSGHGLVIDVTHPDANNRRLLVLTWFVYVDGHPTWVQGVGVPHAGSGSAANTVVVQMDQVGIFKGVSFPLGAAHPTPSVWGSISLTFTDANTGVLTWKSTYPGFNSGSIPIKHFLAVGLPAQDAPGAQVKACYSGNWFNPAETGHGFEFEVLSAAPPTLPILTLDWFAYSPTGAPVWLVGSGPLNGNSAQMHLLLIDGTGAQFPPNFDPGQLTDHDWGTATITFNDAAHAQVTWNSTIDGYGSGTQPLQPISEGLLDRRECR